MALRPIEPVEPRITTRVIESLHSMSKTIESRIVANKSGTGDTFKRTGQRPVTMAKVVEMANQVAMTEHHLKRGSVMAAAPEFQHIRMSRVKDVVVVEIISKDLQGPAAARELGAELSKISAQEWAKQLLLNFERISYLSSTGFAVMFKLISQFKAKGGELKLCNLDPGIRLGAEIVGLDKLVAIYDSEALALASFAKN